MTASCWNRFRSIWLVAIIFLASCAINSRDSAIYSVEEQWQGRLSVRIDGATAQSLSSAFALRGDLRRGDLTLASPIGTVLAQARWDEHGVLWQAGSESTAFADLDQLSWQLTGTALPFAALWDWLRGVPTETGGWQVNLQDFAQGRISAHREHPQPTATLRIVLER